MDDEYLFDDGDSESFEELDESDLPKEEDFEPNGRYYVLKNLKQYIDPKPSKEKLKKITYDYKNGTREEQNEALNQMYGVLCCYIWNYLNAGYYSYMPKHGEDLFAEALLGVMDGMQGYNPDYGQPTTWFKRTIKHRILTYINRYMGHSSAHFTSAEKEVKELARQKEEKGIPYTIRDLHLETGIPLKTIENALQMGNVTVGSISTGEKDFDIYSKNGNPESMMAQSENNEAIYNAVYFGGLTEDEKFVICHKLGLFGAEELSLRQIRAHLGKDKSYDIIYSSALKKIKAAFVSGKKIEPKEKKKPAKKARMSGDVMSKEELLEEELLLLEEEEI